MQKPDKQQTALLQARHLYNDARVIHIEHGGGFTIGKDTLTIRVNRLAWGYFEQAILKALKDDKFLREWSPELFSDDKVCPECKGEGFFPIEVGTKEYDEAFESFKGFELPGEKPMVHGETKFSRPCNPCQNTGVVLKPQQEIINDLMEDT